MHVCTRWDDRRFAPVPAEAVAAVAPAAAAIEDDIPAAKLGSVAAPDPIPAPFRPVPYRRHFSSTAVACAVEDLWPLLVRLFTAVLKLQPAPPPRTVSSAAAAPRQPAPPAQAAAPPATATAAGGGGSHGRASISAGLTSRGVMAMFGLGDRHASQPTAAAAASAPASRRGDAPHADEADSEPLVAAALGGPASPADTELRLSVLDTLKHALTAALFLGLARQVQEGADALLQVGRARERRRRRSARTAALEKHHRTLSPCPVQFNRSSLRSLCRSRLHSQG